MSLLRVAFAGTPVFAHDILRPIVAAGFEVPLVLTQPDRPAGRGLKSQASAVKQLAQAQGLAVLQPRSLRLDGKAPQDAAAARHTLLAASPDVLVVAAYGLILPPWLLELPRLGCLNVHASLLPRWRGAAPVQRAIEAGDSDTGITLMQMDAGLDTGAMLRWQALPIAGDDTAASLTDKLAALGACMMVSLLHDLSAASLPGWTQPDTGVTYARKIEKAEAALDWHDSAARIERRVRAFDPFPGASFGYGGETLKLWRATVTAGTPGASPGTVLAADAHDLRIACGEQALQLLEVQRPGGRRVPVAQLMHSPWAAAIRPGVQLSMAH